MISDIDWSCACSKSQQTLYLLLLGSSNSVLGKLRLGLGAKAWDGGKPYLLSLFSQGSELG